MENMNCVPRATKCFKWMQSDDSRSYWSAVLKGTVSDEQGRAEHDECRLRQQSDTEGHSLSEVIWRSHTRTLLMTWENDTRSALDEWWSSSSRNISLYGTLFTSNTSQSTLRRGEFVTRSLSRQSSEDSTSRDCTTVYVQSHVEKWGGETQTKKTKEHECLRKQTLDYAKYHVAAPAVTLEQILHRLQLVTSKAYVGVQINCPLVNLQFLFKQMLTAAILDIPRKNSKVTPSSDSAARSRRWNFLRTIISLGTDAHRELRADFEQREPYFTDASTRSWSMCLTTRSSSLRWRRRLTADLRDDKTSEVRDRWYCVSNVIQTRSFSAAADGRCDDNATMTLRMLQVWRTTSAEKTSTTLTVTQRQIPKKTHQTLRKGTDKDKDKDDERRGDDKYDRQIIRSKRSIGNRTNKNSRSALQGWDEHSSDENADLQERIILDTILRWSEEIVEVVRQHVIIGASGIPSLVFRKVIMTSNGRELMSMTSRVRLREIKLTISFGITVSSKVSSIEVFKMTRRTKHRRQDRFVINFITFLHRILLVEFERLTFAMLSTYHSSEVRHETWDYQIDLHINSEKMFKESFWSALTRQKMILGNRYYEMSFQYFYFMGSENDYQSAKSRFWTIVCSFMLKLQSSCCQNIFQKKIQ